MLMTVLILLSVFLGILAGAFIVPEHIITQIDSISTLLLGLLIFCVGIDIGSNKSILKNIREKSVMLFAIVGSSIVGCFIAGIVAAMVFNMDKNISLSITAGYGWYSLSGIMLKNLAGPEIGAIAFLTNVFREIIAFIMIPILAKEVNYFSSIAPAGATSMDTTLPLISKLTNPDFAVIAFMNGVILSSLVPILVPFFYAL